MATTLHDWTLESINLNWPARSITVHVSGQKETGYIEEVKIIAKCFSNLSIPRYQEWGKSVSIYQIFGPDKHGEKEHIFKIKMQTGDVISIIAESIEILPSVSIKLLD